MTHGRSRVRSYIVEGDVAPEAHERSDAPAPGP